MKIYDISQEVFSCEIYPGDLCPTYDRVKSFEAGDSYAVTNISMCAHNGTHVDAPHHFLKDGKTIDAIPTEDFVGRCRVITVTGDATAEKLSAAVIDGDRKICIRGGGCVTEDGAEFLVSRGVRLVGVEGQSVSDPESPAKVHRILLGGEVVILEGIRLYDIADGEYFLFAAPINLGGAEGAPCRALLIDGIL